MNAQNTELQVQDAQKQALMENDTERTRETQCFSPRVDIYETSEDIFVLVDMPGVDENNIDITLEKNILTLEGRNSMVTPNDYDLVYAEYEMGDYTRRFTLSNEIDQAKIEAKLRNGVLHLRLPKAGPAKAKKIAVKTA